MEKNTSKINTLFHLPLLGLTVMADQYANILWKTENSMVLPLVELPWKFQKFFYFTFLHNDQLAERFKDYEILGAIDIYIKSTYYLGEDLALANI